MLPETRYATSGDVSIAWQATGDGPVDLVLVPGYVSQVEVWWEEPEGARFLRGLAGFSRLITFDKRGTGLSDRVAEMPSLEQRVDDLRAVLDAAGSREAILFGFSEGGPASVLFAATHPERVRGLVLYGASPWFPWRREHKSEMIDYFERIIAQWGRGTSAELFCPSAVGDARLMRWSGRWERMSASPGGARQIVRLMSEIDVDALLPTLRVPTRVLHREHDRAVPVDAGRYLASRIPSTELRILPGMDHAPFLGDADGLVAEVEEFATGNRTGRDPDRVVSTVLFTDIVDSTVQASTLGDARWRAQLDRHDAIAHNAVAAFRGRLVKSTGDGILAVFDGPARAVRCALEMSREVAAAGLRIRAGVHTGEVELRGDDIAGITVHAAARVMSMAGPSEVFVSRAVRDLLPGSGLAVEPRGERALKGLDGTWALFAAR